MGLDHKTYKLRFMTRVVFSSLELLVFRSFTFCYREQNQSLENLSLIHFILKHPLKDISCFFFSINLILDLRFFSLLLSFIAMQTTYRDKRYDNKIVFIFRHTVQFGKGIYIYSNRTRSVCGFLHHKKKSEAG